MSTEKSVVLPAAAASPQPCEDGMLSPPQQQRAIVRIPAGGALVCIDPKWTHLIFVDGARVDLAALAAMPWPDAPDVRIVAIESCGKPVSDVVAVESRAECDRAVAAERERCARIAEEHMSECDGNGCTDIADKIRSGK